VNRLYFFLRVTGIFVSIEVKDSRPVETVETPNTRHKSAGLAFLLSVLAPGLGQLYCGKFLRGGFTLGVMIAAIAFVLGRTEPFFDIAIVVAFALWLFSFVDAYFTADEINAGIDEQLDGHNPRVAATLNLLTNGWGYFYLDQQGKGIALMLILNIIRFSVPSSKHLLAALVSAGLTLISLVIAADAYRIARRELQQWPTMFR